MSASFANSACGSVISSPLSRRLRTTDAPLTSPVVSARAHAALSSTGTQTSLDMILMGGSPMGCASRGLVTLTVPESYLFVSYSDVQTTGHHSGAHSTRTQVTQ